MITTIIFTIIGYLLMAAMFSGFLHSKPAGCTTMVIFGLLLLIWVILPASNWGHP